MAAGSVARTGHELQGIWETLWLGAATLAALYGLYSLAWRSYASRRRRAAQHPDP